MIKNYIHEIVANSLKKSNIPKYWIEYIRDPTSTVTVKFPLIREDNSIETIVGHRVIHSNHHLPTKGGLRFATDTSYDSLGALASIIVRKNLANVMQSHTYLLSPISMHYSNK